MDLRRRNSDPATQLPPPPVPPPPLAPVYSPTSDLLEWKGTSMFTIAGHKFRKVARFSKEDRCSFCAKTMDAFVTQGHKCTGQFQYKVKLASVILFKVMKSYILVNLDLILKFDFLRKYTNSPLYLPF